MRPQAAHDAARLGVRLDVVAQFEPALRVLQVEAVERIEGFHRLLEPQAEDGANQPRL
jgi:hypothetical protein